MTRPICLYVEYVQGRSSPEAYVAGRAVDLIDRNTIKLVQLGGC